MTLDLEMFSAEARERQIELGRMFGSELTLNQANQTLAAYAQYQDDIVGHGFTVGDAVRLGDARDLLIAAGVGRDFAKGEKQVASKGVDEALSWGRTVRLQGRTVIEGVMEDVEESKVEGRAEIRRRLKAVMGQTGVVADTREGLSVQLDRLAQVLADEAVVPFAAERGGPEVIELLQTAATALREAEKQRAGVRGTPAETQRLDQIDGIIVRLVRRARKASVSAARATGNPALAKAFRLSQLYPSRSGAPMAEEPGDDDLSMPDNGAEPSLRQ